MSANGISTLGTKALRQVAKLDLAQAKRKGTTQGSALVFSSPSQLSLSDAANLKLHDSTAFTIEFFIYMTAYQTVYAPSILQKGGQKNVNYSTYTFLMFTGKIYFSTGTGAGGQNTGGKEVTSSTDLPLNAWTHIAVVWDGTNLNLYQNGVNVGTAAASPLQMGDNSSGVTIGNITGGTDYFIGKLSNIRIVKNVAVYTGAFTVPSIPLTSTQSSGTNITAITGTATSLLLNAASSATYLTDSSSYGATVSNSNVTWSATGPAIANIGANFYRARNTYDITRLPTQYTGNALTNNANTGGLVAGRPWGPTVVGVIETPTTITESVNSDTLIDLQVWYDAADTATFTPSPSDESSITQWQDKSILAHNANSTGSKKPTYENTTLQAGYGYVEFDGVNDIMSVNPFTQLQSKSGYTVFLVSKLADTTGIQYLTETNQNDLRMNSNGTTMEVGMQGAVGTVASEANTNWCVHTIVFDGTQTGNAARLVYRKNKTAKTLSFTGTVAATTSASNTHFYIGNSSSEASPMQGFVAELILFDKTLTATEYANVENYLTTKWGL
jgi:hypothetical protein